jgi:hypothetical protein
MMKSKTLLWLIPLLAAIHNAEEAATMPRFLGEGGLRLPAAMREIASNISYPQFLAALVFVTLIPIIIAAFSDLSREHSGAAYALLCTQVVMFINVFWHLAMALLTRGYVPGLISAMAINLPLSIYILRRALVERWFSRRATALAFLIAFFLHAPVLWLIMTVTG